MKCDRCGKEIENMKDADWGLVILCNNCSNKLASISKNIKEEKDE